MDSQSLEKLIEKKIKSARRGRVGRSILLLAIIAALVGGCAYAIADVDRRPPAEQTGQTSDETETSGTSTAEGTAAQQPADSSVTDPSGQGQPAPQDPPVPQSLTHEMKLVWFGASDDVPDALDINVMHDGEKLFTATLTEADGWCYTWEDEYPAQALQLEGNYPDSISAEYTVLDENFALTATCVAGALPQTGPNTLIGLLMMALGAAITAISFACKAKESRHERTGTKFFAA